MATKIPSPAHPMSSRLPTPKHFKSRFSAIHFAAYLHKSAFSFGKTLCARLCFFHVSKPYLRNTSKRIGWSIRSSADGNGLNPASPTNKSRSGTRLTRALQFFQIKVNVRIEGIRKDFPIKLLCFLVGFYCSTVFATVIGQTGDWDILAAALAMAVVEGIGFLTYRASLPLFDNARNLITMFNYWKAGLSLGLFLDSFKYEMDNIFGLWKPFTFDLNLCAIFW